MADKEPKSERLGQADSIELPRPTPWPIVLALGVTLSVMGIVTSVGVSYLGFVLVIAGCIGWFFDVFPHPKHEQVPLKHQTFEFHSTRRSVDRIHPRGRHTEWAPVQIHPLLVGIQGGIIGGIAMIIPAMIYGLYRYHSIWYVPNLMGGAGLTGWVHPTMAEITSFRPTALFFAVIIDGTVSIMVGILYAALLPILPRFRVLIGGIIAPILWSIFLIYQMDKINPYLASHTDWYWFSISQIAFGLVTAWLVNKKIKYPGGVNPTLAVRFGVHTPWVKDGAEGKGK